MAKISKSVVASFFHISLLLLAMTGFSYHLSTLIRRHMGAPTSTEMVRVTQDFPEIMLCNNFPMTQSSVIALFNSPVGKSIAEYSFGVVAKLLAYGLLEEASPDINEMDRNAQNTLTKVVMSSGQQIAFREYGNKKHVFILSCKYNGIQCSHEDFEEIFHREYINCFKFKRPNDTDITSLDLVLYADMANPSDLNEKYDFFKMPFIHLYPNGEIKWDITPGVNVFIYPKGEVPMANQDCKYR